VSCPAEICLDESLRQSAEMKRAWAELEATYPRPDESSHLPNLPDGSWQGPSGHRLDPSQNADVAD
jgi:hypothetical protein